MSCPEKFTFAKKVSPISVESKGKKAVQVLSSLTMCRGKDFFVAGAENWYVALHRRRGF